MATKFISICIDYTLVNLAQALNAFFDLFNGGKNRPVFFNIKETFPALLEIDKNYQVIRDELELVLPRHKSIPKYHELDQDQYDISAQEVPDKDWRVFMLYMYGELPESNRQLCPQTSAILDKIPNLFAAFFSILDGGKSIPAHNGPYHGYLRYHLGLKVPKNNPPKIRIKDQFYLWSEQESVLFDDSWEHEVYNQCDEIRVVLVVDVLRPLPLIPHYVNKFIFNSIVRYIIGRRVKNNLNNYEKAVL